MNNPWDLRTDDERTVDTKINFIIFCEDTVSEPSYFKYFETSKIKVNCIPNQKSMMKNVINAIHHCNTAGLMEHRGDGACMIEGTQVWCVFDRDREDSIDAIARGNIEFDESIESAKRNGLKVAWSNDAFELWVLLHFEDVKAEDINRKIYYDRLTEIFRNLPEPNDYLQRVLLHDSYSYKKDFKSEKNFRNIVRAAIVGKTEDAIERAKKIEHAYRDRDVRNHEKTPFTLVHHLVEELLRHGNLGMQNQ